MAKKSVRFRTPGYIFGEAINEAAISIRCPERMRDGIRQLAYRKELSMSRYILGLMITDLKSKDEQFKKYMDSIDG